VEFWDYDTRLGAYAVIVDAQDRVLLALWNEASRPRWALPGGGVELEESPAAAAVRELHEETGYHVELGDLLGVETALVPPERRLSGHDRWLKTVQVVYTARVVGGELRHEVDGTTDEARWIPLSEVPDLHRVSVVDAALDLWRAHSAGGVG
jgi:8-oxo-dGTP diphosphatase